MMDIESLRSENIALKLQLEEQKQVNTELMKKIPKIQAALTRADIFIYQMKTALFNADDQYKQAVSLFDPVEMPGPVKGNVQYIARLVKQGRSISQMAEMLLGSKSKKGTMHRMLKEAKKTHPQLFKQEEANLFPKD